MRIPTVLRTGVFQLTLAYALLFGASVAAILWFIYWSSIGSIEEQADSVIRAEIQGLAEQYERRGLPGLVEIIRERTRRDPDGQSVYLLADATLRPVAGNMAFWPEQFNRRGEWVNFTKVSPAGRAASARALVLQVGQGYRLMVGRENSELETVIENIRRASVYGFGLTLALALIGGLLMSLQAQRKVARINRTARQIIAGDLSRRIPISGARDEFDELARNINNMLDRIEGLLQGLRHVGDSIAHDLRGPLTRLGNQLEMLAGQPQPSREGLAHCAAQAEALLGTFNALLRIARVESGAYRSAFARTDLARVVTDVCELYRVVAEEHGLEFAFSAAEPALVFGDRELLAQALTNLIDNAVKYTPDGGTIRVEMQQADGEVRIEVRDSGPGIPAEHRDRVFERFVRLDQSRSLPGNGLGLALVRAVADQHDGTLDFGDLNPGLMIRLSLPLYTPARGRGDPRVAL